MADTAPEPLALIMKGGGVKGLAYVGAIDELQKQYNFNWFVGTSAGAIAALLLGAGYTVEELRQELERKDFRDFFDASRPRALFNLYMYGGLFKADAFTSWIDRLLSAKLKRPTQVKLKHLPHRVTVYASRRNQTAQRFDSVDDGETPAAWAVRCSMSIPGVFIPQSVVGFNAYDGGVQNNYPVSAFLNDYHGTPFVGLYLGQQTYQSTKQPWFVDLYYVLTEASDVEALDQYHDRTVVVDPRPIGTLDFGLSQEEKNFLVASGREGALAFIAPNSDSYIAAAAERNRLEAVVESQRQQEIVNKRRRQIWKWIRRAAAVVIICCAWFGWKFWSNLPRVATITFPAYMEDFEAARDIPAKLDAFKQAYTGQLATWPAVVLKVHPDTTSPSLLVGPVVDDASAHSMQANFRPGNFDEAAALREGTQIILRGFISKDTNVVGPMLDDCQVLGRPK